MKIYLKILLLLLALSLGSCLQNPSSGPCGCDNVLYYNSFENPDDLTGWIGLSKDQIVDKSAPDDSEGGKKALYIGGGCLQPAATFKIPVTEQGQYIFYCRARSADSMSFGQIKISRQINSADSTKSSVKVNSTDWRTYYGDKQVFFNPGDTLFVEIYIGGIRAEYMYIDELKVEKIKLY